MNFENRPLGADSRAYTEPNDLPTKRYLKESPLAKETEGFPISVITISGRSGTGKTATVYALKELIEQWTQNPVNALKVGEEIIRNPMRETTGQEVLGEEQRTRKEDLWIEGIMRERMLQATPDSIGIIEGWTAAFNARTAATQAIKEGRPEPVVIRILLVSRNRKRFPRIAKRQGVTVREAKEKTQKREAANYARFSKIYPEMKGIDPYNPVNIDNKGEPIYTLVVDTNELGYQEVAQLVFDWLVEHGNIHPNLTRRVVDAPTETQEQFPTSGQIFPAI